MKDERIESKAVKSVGWSYAERVVTQLISTIVGIVLARILDPSHYGVIAIVNIIISFCNVFVETGIGESLVQKKDADEVDFSSIFFLNLGISILLYTILFFLSPVIAEFYNDGYEGLSIIIRVMGIRLILAAINSIQRAKVSKSLEFKKFFFVTLFGTLVSGVAGVIAALNGLGVWALVIQYLANSVIDTIMLFIFVRWLPRLAFSLKRVRPLLKYGLKILSAAFINTVYGEIRGLIIGKVYSASDLAYYNKGGTYPKMIVNNLSGAISSVLFPVFTKLQDDRDHIKRILKRTIKLYSFLLFPAMTGFIIVAPNFVRLLLTEKWLPCVPYLQILCFCYAIMTISQANLQCLTSLGYSKEYLIISIFKRLFAIIVLVAVFRLGVIYIAISQAAVTLIELIVDISFGGKKVKYGILEQLNDILPNLLLSLIMALVLFVINYLTSNVNYIFQLVADIILGVAAYTLMSKLTHNDSFNYILLKGKSYILKRKQRSKL